MKKLVAMIGAVAAAFGLYAADFTSSVMDDIQSRTVGDTEIVGSVDAVTGGIHWWDDNYTATDYEQPAAVSNETEEVGNYLKIETEGSPLLRTFDAVTTSDEGKASYNAMDITDHGIFIDTKVRLTGFESDPEIKDGNTNKLLVWLKTVESEDDVEGSTNLMVTCGYWEANKMTPTNYVLTAEGYEAKPGEWIQLTIRADKDTENNVPLFKIFVNEKQATATVDSETLEQFPSLIGGAAADLSLKAAGFEGSGDLNKVDLLSQADAPAFAADLTYLTLTWDEHVTAITIGGKNVIEGKEGSYDYPITAFGENITATITYENGFCKKAVTPSSGFVIGEDGDNVTFQIAQYGVQSLTIESKEAREGAGLVVDGDEAGNFAYVKDAIAYLAGLQDGFTAATITVLEDELTCDNFGDWSTLDGSVTLDLAGKKIHAVSPWAGAKASETYTEQDCIINNGATGGLTIKDSVGGGELVGIGDGTQDGDVVIVVNESTLTLDAVEGKTAIKYCGQIWSDTGIGTMLINGGLFNPRPKLDDVDNKLGDNLQLKDIGEGWWEVCAAEPPTAYFPTEDSIAAGYKDQDGSADHPFIIMDAADIVAIAEDTDAATWATKSFKIADEADATLTIADPFTISADYTGTFDGNGREIVFTAKKGVAGSDDCYAFFCKLNGATIKNVTFNGTVAGDKKLLAIVAAAAGGTVTFEDVITKGSVTSCYSAGGFVCRADAGTFTFTRCVNKADVTMNSYNASGTLINTNLKGAGFVTYPKAANKYTFTGCQNEGDITITAEHTHQAAGFFAYSNLTGGDGELATFNSCTNIGDIATYYTASEKGYGNAAIAISGFVSHGQPANDSAAVFNDVVNTGAISYNMVEGRHSGCTPTVRISGINADAPVCTLNGVQSLGTITINGKEYQESQDTIAIGALSAANAEPTIGAGDIVTRADVPAVAVACDAVTYGVVNGSVVDEFVAANALEVGGAYVVLAPGAAPEIELANENNAITFTGVCEFDDTGITTVDGLKIEKSGTGTVTYTAVPDSKPVVDPSTGANDIPAESAEIACAKVDMAVPTDVAKVISGEDQATYLTYFTKVATPGSAAGLWNVKMELNELGTNTLSAAAEITDITLEADEDGDISLTPTTLVPGFYYGIAASAEVGSVKSATVPAEGWSLATSATAFDKPLKAAKPSDAKGFFVLKVSPTK